jgi:antitoxin component YwqK of YwqJK toxin-antitoxin module
MTKPTTYTHYHKDGSLYGKGLMLGEKMHGAWVWLRKDGSLMRSGHFEKGVQTDTWVTYDKTGKVVKTTIMK